MAFMLLGYVVVCRRKLTAPRGLAHAYRPKLVDGHRLSASIQLL
jgi:hypothetical protein